MWFSYLYTISRLVRYISSSQLANFLIFWGFNMTFSCWNLSSFFVKPFSSLNSFRYGFLTCFRALHLNMKWISSSSFCFVHIGQYLSSLFIPLYLPISIWIGNTPALNFVTRLLLRLSRLALTSVFVLSKSCICANCSLLKIKNK